MYYGHRHTYMYKPKVYIHVGLQAKSAFNPSMSYHRPQVEFSTSSALQMDAGTGVVS